MKAFLKNYRQSPRKVALVTGLIKGKRVSEAFVFLDNLPKRAAEPIKGLLVSAVSNAKQVGVAVENLIIENITVNKGIVMKRSMPRARGSASKINKRTSHVLITLKEIVTAEKVKKAPKIIKEKSEKKSKSVKKLAPKS